MVFDVDLLKVISQRIQFARSTDLLPSQGGVIIDRMREGEEGIICPQAVVIISVVGSVLIRVGL